MQPGFDTTKPHSARVYDYYLGGKDHFAADSETGQRAMQSWPAVRTAVRENRPRGTYRQAGIPAQARTAAEFATLAFGGLEMIDPGVVLVSQWHPPAGPRPRPDEVNWYGGIGRKLGLCRTNPRIDHPSAYAAS